MPSGIIGYGAYIPMYRIRASEIAKMWGKSPEAVPIKEKAVAGPDEDVATIAVEASLNALARAGIDPSEIGAVHVGTESKPYAVKSTGITVAEAIGASRMITCADYELACKAGTEALQTCLSHVESGFAKYGLAIGVDTAQGRPGDELEYTAASGGAAFIVGLDNLLAVCEGRCSWSSDTPDFWRREGQKYPVHAGRFTGAPAYFKHIINAAKALMEKLNFKPEDFTYAVFHQPNTKFPIKVAQILGFNMKQIEPGLLSPIIGNCYAGSSLLGLAAVLDVAKPDDRILVVSYGSGSGSDAFSFKVTELIEEKRDKAPLVKHYIERKVYIDYATYAKFRGKINLG